MTNFRYDALKGWNFVGGRRNSSMLTMVKYKFRCPSQIWADTTPNLTDIHVVKPPVDVPADPRHVPVPTATVIPPVINYFIQGHCRKDHLSSFPNISSMQEEAVSQEDEHELDDLEWGTFEHEQHGVEENMDRLVNQGNGTRSFIPVDIGKSYLNEVMSYYKELFGHLPNEYYAVDFENNDMKLNLEKSMANIEANFEIDHRLVYRYHPKRNSKKTEPGEVNYVLKNGMLLFLSSIYNAFIAVYDQPEQIKEMTKHVVASKIRKEPEKPKFQLLVHNNYGFGTEDFDLKHFEVDIKANYNEDLPDEKIRDFIESDNEAGLCILHGKPGTGKTYYIRDLIKNSKRDFIYMNKECLQYINDASFIAFLIKAKNSVFIMEDCENVLASRTEYNNTISTLLNLSDGLLGDSLNNKFICTFNTDISNIDEALLRKGRMKVCYEFKYLSPEKANALAEKLNRKGGFDKEVPLCDVMNSDSNGNEDIPVKKKLNKIGF